MLQAVIDTNILVRANITENGSDFLVYKAFLNGEFRFLFSEGLISEINRVLHYGRIFKRYNFSDQKISEFLDSIVTFGKFVHNPRPVKICRDKDDDEILSVALAIAGKNPVYVVSGDKDLLELKGKVEGVKILTASEFLKIL